MSEWTEKQIIFLQQHLTVEPTERYVEYCSMFGPHRTIGAVNRQALRCKTLNEVNMTLMSDMRKDDEISVTTPVVSQSSATADRLRAAFGRSEKRDLNTKIQDREDLNSFVNRLIEESYDTFDSFVRPVVNSGSSLCIALSDTHIGKLTGNFNKEVFIERLISIPDMIKDQDILPFDCKEIVLMLAGDMLEGEDIYQTQAHHLEMSAIDQVQIAVETIWDLTLKLRDAFALPVRIVTCPGNHGRVSKAAAEKTNWDNIIYQTLGFIINSAKMTNVSIEVNFDAFVTFSVQDKIGMLFHHGTKHLGTAAMQSRVAGWLHTKQFDFYVHGHWHMFSIDSQFGKIVVANGSLPGDDDLSERMGVYEPPRQGWLVVRTGQPLTQFGCFQWSNK